MAAKKKKGKSIDNSHGEKLPFAASKPIRREQIVMGFITHTGPNGFSRQANKCRKEKNGTEAFFGGKLAGEFAVTKNGT